MFKERFKILRKRTGLTQEEFAKDFGISTATVTMWETGKRNPSYSMMIKLSKYFGVNLSELEEETASLNHNLIESAPLLDSLPQLYDAEQLTMTLLSLPEEDKLEIERLIYAKAKEAKARHTLADVRNIFVDIRIDPEADDEQISRSSAQEDFAEYR